MPQTCDHQIIIACSALKNPLKKMLQKLDYKATVRYLEAGLHLSPQLLKEELTHAIELACGEGAEVKIVYGNCCPEIDEVCHHYRARRTNVENCYQLYLGDRYLNLIQEEPGTYFLDPFLANNFKDLVIKPLGMDRHPKLKSMFFNHYKRLIYIDVEGTGLTFEAKFVAEYLALPIETIKGDSRRFQHLFTEIL